MKKLISMFLVVSLCLSLSITSFATENVNKDESDQNKAFKVFQQDKIKKSKLRLEKFKKDKDFVVTYENDDGNYTIVPSENVTNKKEYIAKLHEVKAQDDEYSLVGDDIRGYSDGSLFVGFTSTAYGDWNYIPVAGSDCITFNGSSDAWWDGYSPARANSINCSDTFNVGYVGLSLSIGSGAIGGTVTSNNSGCTLTYTPAQNTWSVDHNFSNVTGYAYVITSITEYSSATFTFGTSSYALQANMRVVTPH